MGKHSYASRASSVGRLELYLESDGSQLPRDWRDYKMQKKGQCVFCDHPNSYFQVYQYKFGELKSDGVNTGTLACAKCTAHIRRMEDTLPGIKSKGGVPSDLVDVESIIDAYIFHGELPERWAQYIIHSKGATRTDRCFFCDGGSDPSNPNELNLPVTHSQFITGGRVHACSSCLSMYLHMSMEMDVVKDECYHCGTHYPIDDHEYVYRRDERTMTHHSCPACTEVLVVRTGRADVTDEGHLRNKIEQCCYCRVDIAIDLTISAPLVDARRKVKKGYVCDTCMLETERIDFYGMLHGKPQAVKILPKKVIYVYELGVEKYLVRTVHTDGSGRGYTPIQKKELINVLLQNDKK